MRMTMMNVHVTVANLLRRCRKLVMKLIGHYHGSSPPDAVEYAVYLKHFYDVSVCNSQDLAFVPIVESTMSLDDLKSLGGDILESTTHSCFSDIIYMDCDTEEWQLFNMCIHLPRVVKRWWCLKYFHFWRQLVDG